jgi:hypothetical protein
LAAAAALRKADWVEAPPVKGTYKMPVVEPAAGGEDLIRPQRRIS